MVEHYGRGADQECDASTVCRRFCAPRRQSAKIAREPTGAIRLALTAFDVGKLKIVNHVREELDRAGIVAESIRCNSGGLETPRGVARLTIVACGTSATLDFRTQEVEDCEMIVVGETWHKIAALIGGLSAQSNR